MLLLYVFISKFILQCHTLKVQLPQKVNTLQLLQKGYRVLEKFCPAKILYVLKDKVLGGTAPSRTPFGKTPGLAASLPQDNVLFNDDLHIRLSHLCFKTVCVFVFLLSFATNLPKIDRLDEIAADAELQEKSTAELTKLANALHDGCERAIKEYQEKLVSDPNFDGKLD